MRGKWTTILFHTKMSKDPKKGFMKMYVNNTLYNVFEGRTSFGGEHYNKFGIYHSKFHYTSYNVKCRFSSYQ